MPRGQSALQELIKRVIAHPDRQATGVDDLGREARRLGEIWLAKLAAAAAGDLVVAEGHRAAKRFVRADGPWRALHDHLHASADAIHKHWASRYAAAVAACTPLSLGEQHPGVAKALAEVGHDLSASRDKTKELYAEVRHWKALIDQLRDWSIQDAEDIRAAFCAAPDAGEYAEAEAVADRWATQLAQQFGQIEGMADQLKGSADALIAKGRNADRMNKLKLRIDATASTA